MKITNIAQYTDLELALMVLLGYFGNGQTRKNNLGARYNTVQSMVEQILRGTMPAGTGSAQFKEELRSAVKEVFQDTIDEITEEIINAVR